MKKFHDTTALPENLIFSYMCTKIFCCTFNWVLFSCPIYRCYRDESFWNFTKYLATKTVVPITGLQRPIMMNSSFVQASHKKRKISQFGWCCFNWGFIQKKNPSKLGSICKIMKINFENDSWARSSLGECYSWNERAWSW